MSYNFLFLFATIATDVIENLCVLFFLVGLLGRNYIFSGGLTIPIYIEIL